MIIVIELSIKNLESIDLFVLSLNLKLVLYSHIYIVVLLENALGSSISLMFSFNFNADRATICHSLKHLAHPQGVGVAGLRQVPADPKFYLPS